LKITSNRHKTVTQNCLSNGTTYFSYNQVSTR